MYRAVAGSGLLLLLSACASGPGAPPEGPPPARAEIFISPFGEPFVSQPGEPYPVAAWFAGADRDHDGGVNGEEFAADGWRWFAALDLDGDNLLSPAEIVAYERRIDAAFAGVGGGFRSGSGMGGPGRDGRSRGGSGQGPRLNAGEGAGQDDMDGPPRARRQGRANPSERMALAGLLSVPQPVRAADWNVDQKITAEEWGAASDRWFDLLDSDHDGVLRLETLPKTADQGRSERRRR